MADDTAAPRSESHGHNRALTIKFVLIFVASVISLLAGYRYAIDTMANDWYLFQVARHTNAVLALIGYRSELEGGLSVTEPPNRVRATLQAWDEGREPTSDEISAASNNALTAWESWRFRAESVRRSDRPMTLGPRVAFVLRAGTSTRLNEIEQELRRLRQQRIGDQAEVKKRMGELEEERKPLREILQRARTEEGAEDPNPSYVFHFIVVPECGAIEVMAIFFAAVAAFPTRWWKRLLGLLLGLPLMYLVNIFRLSCLAVIGALDGGGQWFNFAHHYVWQAIYIIFVVAVWLAWVEYFVRRKEA